MRVPCAWHGIDINRCTFKGNRERRYQDTHLPVRNRRIIVRISVIMVVIFYYTVVIKLLTDTTTSGNFYHSLNPSTIFVEIVEGFTEILCAKLRTTCPSARLIHVQKARNT